MSRVFCISSSTTTDPYAVYPVGMAVIASALSEAGHDVTQFDYLSSGRSEEKLRTAIRQADPNIICMSIRNIDNVDSLAPGNGHFIEGARRLADLIRQTTDAPIIIGGSAVTIMPEEILDYVGADYAVVGEGEHALCTLLDSIQQGETPARILSPNQQLLCGTEIAHPLFEPGIVQFYQEESGILGIQTKRGCPMACTYCTYPALEGSRYRASPPEAVVDTLERAHKDFQVEHFFFLDSVFNDGEGHYIQVLEELARRRLDIRWSAFFSPRGVTREMLSFCKQVGLHAIEFGTDASSTATLSALRKGFSWDDVAESNAACVAEMVPCCHFIMFGVPDETSETVQEGLDNLAQLEHCVVIAFSGVRIFPRTQLQDTAIAEGLLTEDTNLLEPIYYVSPHVNADWMNQTIETAWQSRRDRIFPPTQDEFAKKMMREMGLKGIMWDKLIRMKRRRR